MVKAAKFSLIEGKLYKMGLDEILRRYVPEHERHMILVEAHEGAAGGHYARKDIAQNILRVRLWCPTSPKYAKEYFQACGVCQEKGRIEEEMRFHWYNKLHYRPLISGPFIWLDSSTHLERGLV